VVQRYGPPTSRGLTSEGQQRLIYAYQQMQVDPKAFIPFYGRAYTTEHTQTIIDCDKEGRVQAWTSDQGQDKFGDGLGGGAKQR